jgi:hypothetical protein
MPRRQPKSEKILQEQLKASLDSIMNDENFKIESVTSEDIPRIKSIGMLNFTDATQTTGGDAKSLLDSVVRFYIDDNLISQADYIEYKKKADSTNLASMMLQLKTAQHAITKLLEEIDMGNSNPRMFEVLAQLQSQIMQMPKDYQAYLDKMEQGYKKLQSQIEQKIDKGIVQLEQGDDGSGVYDKFKNDTGIRVRGTKGLMEGLRDIIGTEIEDIKIDDEQNENSVVNARKKSQIDSENESPDDEDSLQIDDDLFN